MTIYIDLVFLLNFCYDFLLLMCVSVVLKRHVKIRRIILGALFGTLSLIILFFKISNIWLFILKILSGIVMCLICYSYKSFKYTINNLIYLYMCSVILAGFLYFLDLEFSYKHEGFIFYFTGLSINYIVLLIIAPLILGLYIYQIKKLKKKQNLYYKVKVVMKNNKEILLNGYIDSGNKLKDPITNKYVIIVEKRLINSRFIRSPMLVPFKTINYNGFLKCFSPKYIMIDNKIYNNYLLGIYEGVFNIEEVGCILNSKLLEEM